jgi:hypothetical protein
MTDQEPSPAENAATRRLPDQPTTAPAPSAARQRGGCVGRFFAALLVVVITSIIALAAVATGLLYLGFTPAMPRQLDAAQIQVGTLQAQNSALQTEVAAQGLLGREDHEVLSEIERQITGLDQLQSQLRQEREAALVQNATLVAEARSSRDAVAVFATAEASRAALLQQLEQRSARVERFLQRLSDIAGDASIDLGEMPTQDGSAPSATPPAEATSISNPELSPTPEPVPAGSTAEATATRTPRPTSTPTATLGR